MNKKLISLVAAATLSTCVYAESDNKRGLYSEISYETFNESNDDFPDINLSYASLLTGYQFSRNFSAEAVIGTGIGDEVTNVQNISVSSSIGSIYGISLKTQFDISENINAFTKLKYFNIDVEAEAMGFEAAASDSDLGLSIGLEFVSESSLYGTASLSLWGVDDETSQTGLKIGVGYKF
ncbi:outer membrane beta-barrel protein [Glaciecola sp. HTCC2999]|jgi:hypothetical protein|uniref:outer membrane beta-barrel protein n=1 Tax=Glaciecola sp. HTCC2999 TaxID=455436 RepID=UPI0000E105E4|nr:outer membrane beta-barrel protein [Glaciecola sp. HTCC2999]